MDAMPSGTMHKQAIPKISLSRNKIFTIPTMKIYMLTNNNIGIGFSIVKSNFILLDFINLIPANNKVIALIAHIQ